MKSAVYNGERHLEYARELYGLGTRSAAFAAYYEPEQRKDDNSQQTVSWFAQLIQWVKSQ